MSNPAFNPLQQQQLAQNVPGLARTNFQHQFAQLGGPHHQQQQHPFLLAQQQQLPQAPPPSLQQQQQPPQAQQLQPGLLQTPRAQPSLPQFAINPPSSQQLLHKYSHDMRLQAAANIPQKIPFHTPTNSAPTQQFPQFQGVQNGMPQQPMMPPPRPPTAAGSPQRYMSATPVPGQQQPQQQGFPMQPQQPQLQQPHPQGMYPQQHAPPQNGMQVPNGVAGMNHQQLYQNGTRPPSAMSNHGYPGNPMGGMPGAAGPGQPQMMYGNMQQPPQHPSATPQPTMGGMHGMNIPNLPNNVPPPAFPQGVNPAVPPMNAHVPQPQPPQLTMPTQPMQAPLAGPSHHPPKPPFSSLPGIDPASLSQLQAQFGQTSTTSMLASGAASKGGPLGAATSTSLQPPIPALPGAAFANSLHPQVPVPALPVVVPARPSQPPVSTAESTMTQQQRAALINANVTRISQVPVEDAERLLPPLEDAEIQKIKGWMETDKGFAAESMETLTRMTAEVTDVFHARKPRWFEREARDPPPKHGFHLVWPHQKKEDRVRKLQAMGRRAIELPKRPDPALKDKTELLVPIRLDIDILDGHNRLREAFIWNANDPFVTPAVFAQTLCDDFGIAPVNHAKVCNSIVSSIAEQIADFRNHHVEIDRSFSAATATAVAPAATVPTDTKPEIVVTGSPSATPAKPPLGSKKESTSAVAARVVDGIDRKRARTTAELGSGWLDEDESAWWEKWRKRVLVLDGRVVGVGQTTTTASAAAATSTTATTKQHKSKKRRKDKTLLLTNGDIKQEMPDQEGVPEPEGLRDEFAEQALVVDYDEEEKDDGGVNEDLRILIKLDISAGIMRLEDQFEWDIRDPFNNPEQFAERYSKDLGLNGDFKTAIAHSIREQVQVYQKSLYLVGHPADGSKIQDEELRLAFLPSVYIARRSLDQVPTYTPQLHFYAENDMERTERADRRKRRQPRGRRGDKVVLPDREPLKTYRTPAVGFPEPEKEAAAPAAPSRRAAAIAAEKANTQIAVIEHGSPGMTTTVLPTVIPTHVMSNMNNRPSQPPTQPIVEAVPKRTRQELLQGPPVAARVRPSRPLRPSTALDSDVKVPPTWVRSARERAATKPTGKRRGPKERELPEGQHPNMIDGIWHCSNCGCPEDVAVGRRQGPLGPKSMCGQCGKWWHRHRKPLEVEYSTNREFHLEKKKRDDEIRRLKKRGGMKAVQAHQAAQERERLLAQSTSKANSPFTNVPRTSGATPQRSKNRPPPSHVLNSSESSLSPPAMSPPPRRKRDLGPPSSTPRESTQPPSQAPVPAQSAPAPPPPDLVAEILAAPPPAVRSNYSSTAPVERNRSVGTSQRPTWLNDELAKLRARYPDDIFDVLQKTKPSVNGEPAPNPAAASEWRVRCSDCPGKLYNPGAGETLNNFEVHLKNRHHRGRVIARVTGVPVPVTPVAPTPSTPATATVASGPPNSSNSAAPPSVHATSTPPPAYNV